MRTRLGDLLLASAAAWLVTACGLTPSGAQPTTEPDRTVPAATAAAGPTDVASPSLAAPSPTPAPATPAPPTALPSIPTPAPEAEPPLAHLGPAGDTAAPGRQGSWCYGSVCADIIPGPAGVQPLLQLPAAATDIELALPSPYRFVHWRVMYRDAADEDAPMMALAEGGARYPDPDEVPATATTPLPEFSAVTMAGPPSGGWVLQAQLEFAGQTGNASYYWHAVVP